MINKKDIKIVYMGTPEFAVPALKLLAEDGYDVRAAVSQPDKAKNRGKKVLPTPVKEAAAELGIKVLQPERIKGNEEFMAELKEAAPDLIVVAAYGKILPVPVLELPRYGCINIHASLLPRFRGAAPVQRSIIAGDEKTGVTLMYMEEGLDTGDMLGKVETETVGKTGDELEAELSVLGGKLLIELLPDILEENIKGEKQDDSLSCYAPMLKKSEGLIDFSRSADEIERLVRGMNSWPGTYTYLGGEMLKIWEAVPAPEGEYDASGALPGQVLAADKKGIAVTCGEGVLLVKRLQLPGKKALSADDFLRGRKLAPGTVFSSNEEGEK